MAWTPRRWPTAPLVAALSAALALAQGEPTASIAVVGATDGVRGAGPQPFADRGSEVRFAAVAPGAYELHFAATAVGKPASLPLSLAAGTETVVVAGVPPDPDLLYRCDFAASRPLAVVGEGVASAWRIDSGRLWREGAAAAGRSSAVFGNPEWTDVTVSVRACSYGRDGGFGVLFRRTDERNFGLFEWTQGSRTLTQVEDGVATVLVRDAATFALGRFYQIAIGCRGDAIAVAIDRAPILAATTTLKRGAVGLLASGAARAGFDDLVVGRGDGRDALLHGGVAFDAPELAGWTATAVPPDGDARALWQAGGGELRKLAGASAGWTALAIADAENHQQRVAADLRADKGPCGVVLRWQDQDNHYRCVWDPAIGEVRCERLLGGQLFVLGRHAAPRTDDQWHRLSAQADGFRIAAWFDDEPMVQTFDGAHTHGQGGVWAAGSGIAAFARFSIGAPRPPLDVVAATRSVGEDGVEVQVTGRLPQHAGVDYVLSLRLPPPPGLRLHDDRGLEPFLLLADPAAVLPVGYAFGGKWDGVRGSIGPAGEIAARLQWPARSALSGRCVQLGGLVFSPDGEQLIDWLPSVWLRL